MAFKVITHRPDLGIPFRHATQIPAAAQELKKTAQSAQPYATGPALWKQLHLRAIEKERTDDSAWLKEFARFIPCGECYRHWDDFLAKEPPDFTHYFAWTVLVHNSVNLRLGKPILTVDQARSLY